MHGRRIALLGYTLGLSVMVWQSYGLFVTGALPLPLRIAMACLLGFLIVMGLLMWRLFGPAVPITPRTS